MNCHRISNLVSAYIDGELTGEEMLEIRRHLDSCRSCMLQYESLRQTKQMLFRLPYAVPRAEFFQEMCARLDVIEIPYYQRFYQRIRSYGRTYVAPVAAGCAALGAMMFFMVSSPMESRDEIAFDYPVYSRSSAIPLPPVSTTPVADYNTRRDEATTIIPRQPSGNSIGPVFYSSASFEGY